MCMSTRAGLLISLLRTPALVALVIDRVSLVFSAYWSVSQSVTVEMRRAGAAASVYAHSQNLRSPKRTNNSPQGLFVPSPTSLVVL